MSKDDGCVNVQCRIAIETRTEFKMCLLRNGETSQDVLVRMVNKYIESSNKKSGKKK